MTGMLVAAAVALFVFRTPIDTLAVVGIVSSVLSLAVYLRIIAPMYRQQDKTVATQRSAWASPIAIVVMVTLAATIAIGLAAQPLFAWLA